MNEILQAYERMFGVGISIPFGLRGSDLYLYLYGIYKALETGIPYDPQPLFDHLNSITPPPGTVVY